ncbi:MAG: SDR family oxidoreductase [Acidimicrobiia bacterium]
MSANHSPTLRVLVAGSTGYIGRRLVTELVAGGNHVRCLARSPYKLNDERWSDAVEVVRGDVLDAASLTEAFTGIDVAYYLVHSIGAEPDWEKRDRLAAENFRDAATAAGVRQIIYLGGLGDSSAGQLSAHLHSRHEVGRVLAAGPVPVTELRAAVIIGSGSASFEMLRNLVEVLPAMVTPTWVETRCQPIGIRDLLVYAIGVMGRPEAYGEILEVGGADTVTYREMMQTYAEVAGLRRRIIVGVPVLSPRLSSLWVGLVTPLPVHLARPLIDSLVNEVVVHDDRIATIVPHRPMSYRQAVEAALRRVEDLDVATTWADAELYGRTPADPMPTDPSWSGGTVLADEQVLTVDASPEHVFAVVNGIGGQRGWFVADWMWRIRGALDRLVGGVGLRRGRRHPDHLRVGDALDFWRVETVEAPGLLRLRAEMRLPGEAWLEWRITEDEAGTRLEQRARFHPRGLWGRCYWYALVPFHRLVFAPLAKEIGRRARAGAVPSTAGAA